MFLARWFAVAGLAAAPTAPVVIHLLNRRRFRVVRVGGHGLPPRGRSAEPAHHAAARDLLLLVLRMACLLLFGLALARPYFSGLGRGRDQPGSARPRGGAGRQQPQHELREAGRHAAGRREGERPGGHREIAAGEPDFGAADLRLGNRLQLRSLLHAGGRRWRPWPRSSR